MSTIGSRLKHAWNVFSKKEDDEPYVSGGYGYRQDKPRLRYSNERSLIASILTRISIDGSGMQFRHVRCDDMNRYKEDISSGLNRCFTVEANIDQAARAFLQDVILSLLDEGAIAICPIDVTLDPSISNSWDIQSLRVGKIVQWFPTKVTISLYNQDTGRRQEVKVDKKFVAIVENPLAPIMNEPNSTLQRLIRKLNLLDVVDEQSSSGKLDIIIQLPYTIKSEARRLAAEQRREDVEMQLRGSKYGIAYVDATEKITQLNRPSENNLLKQVEFLTELLYSQLGITEAVMSGTADEQTMLNYYNRTIDPILQAIQQGMIRSFLTKTAISQKQWILYFRDPFKLVPVNQIAEIADKFTRNEIMSSNEIRSAIGVTPSKDPKADELRNSNMPAPNEQPTQPPIS